MTAPSADRIRPARPDDAPAMARVFAAAIEAKAGRSYGPRERAAWIARGSAERLAAMAGDPENRLLVVEAATETPGLTGLAGLRGCEVSLLYTAPTAAPGTGVRLLRTVEALARESGLKGLTLNASRNALAFYLSQGYAVLRLASRPLPGGVSLPVCLMAKTLVP
uniref:N-acetyltransferase domain-containing protein n=1 Tax=Desulfovibrio sp. U5L TaxID=596152 RepID=I2Q4H5_9BACT